MITPLLDGEVISKTGSYRKGYFVFQDWDAKNIALK